MPNKRCRIAFPDFEDDRILQAVSILKREAWIEPVIISPPKNQEEIEPCAQHLFGRHQVKGMTLEEARRLARDPYYFAAFSLSEGHCDGVVAGATRTTTDTVRCALRCLGKQKDCHLVFGLFLIEAQVPRFRGRRLLFADCAVSPEPSSRTLAHIGVEAARAFEFFTGETPRVAFLSFSTHESSAHEKTQKPREAVDLARQLDPHLLVDGELQVDAALDLKTAQRKGVSGSPVAGLANVLIFPDLDSGNIGYKLVERLGNAKATGPILWGLNKPMSDLSRGCSVEDVCDTAKTVALMALNPDLKRKGRRRLGETLVELGLITRTQLEQALDIQKRKGGYLGSILASLGHIQEEALLAILGKQSGVEFVSLKEHGAISPDVSRLVPASMAKEQNLIPIAREGSDLTVAVADPFETLSLSKNLKEMTGCNIKMVIAPESEIRSAIQQCYNH